MRNFGLILAAAAALVAAGCGGGSNSSSFAGASSSSSGGAAATVASLTLVTDSPTISSDNSKSATLTAFVRDSNNTFMASVPVAFSATSGGLTITQGTTSTSGVATATLNTAGDPTNRAITITATAGGISSKAVVNVSGTTLLVQGSPTLTAGQTSNYTVTLADSNSKGIPSTAITLTSPGSFVTLSTSTLTTDAQGTAQFTVTGNAAGSGNITVQSLGITAVKSVAVNGNALTFSAPAANAQLQLNTAQTFTAHFTQNGTAVNGATINFSTTRGTLSAASATTVNGDATVTVTSASAGGAVVTATEASSGNSGSISVQFIATLANSIDVQASSFTISPNAPSTITAIVRDLAGNLVTNQTVVFTLTDVTGGTLSLGSAITNTQGRAQTVYTAGSVTSANNGVVVKATVQSNPAITKSVDLTVAGQQLFISLGTGNLVTEFSAPQYSVDYVAQVTDSTGAAVPNVKLTFKVLSQQYATGSRSYSNVDNSWDTTVTKCFLDEDVNQNGILDPGEDYNGNNVLDAGNIASAGPTTAGSDTTNSNGFAYVTVYYPKNYAYYLRVALTAQTSVQGTESSRTTSFVLVGAAADFNTQGTAPPGVVSPFGATSSFASNCTTLPL